MSLFGKDANKFFTPGFGDPLPFLLADPLQFCQLDVNVGGQPFLGLSRDAQLGLSQGSGWAIQEQSRSCCEATPSLF